MANFVYSGGNEGVKYTKNFYQFSPEAIEADNLLADINNLNYSILSETLNSNGKLSIAVGAFRLDYTYFDYRNNGSSISYGNLNAETYKYGTHKNSSKSYGSASTTSSGNVIGYFTKIEDYDYETGIKTVVNGTFDYSKIGGTSYQDYLYYVSGDDTFQLTNFADELDSGKGNDVIYGNGGNDILDGESGSDIINGGDGSDVIRGGTGGDSITPGKGNDDVDGGSGVDEVWFSGKSSDYQFSGTASYLTVKDISSGSKDGTDTLKNIENLRFTNGLKTTSQSLNLSNTTSTSTSTSTSNQISATSTELQQLYIAYFSRPCDPAGLNYWSKEGISRSAFAANMYLQPEFNNVNGNLSIEAQVNQIYLNLFNREGDVDGLLYWSTQINNGSLQLASIANDLIWAAENNSGGSIDSTVLSYKTNAAIAYTAKIQTKTSLILDYQPQSTSPWVTGSNLTEAKNYISGIGQYNTYTSSSIDSSVAKFGSLSSSNSYKLLIDPNLSNVDSITGIQNSTIDSNSFKVTTEEQNLVSSDIDSDYLLLDINYQEMISHSLLQERFST